MLLEGAGDSWALQSIEVLGKRAAELAAGTATRISTGEHMAGRNARVKFERYLVQRSGGVAKRVPLNGSQTMWEITPGGPLALLRSGELDRERRISTKIRPVDLATLLARQDSVVVFLCSRLRPP